MQIKTDDLIYALSEAQKAEKTKLGELAWEKELQKHSPLFWQFLSHQIFCTTFENSKKSEIEEEDVEIFLSLKELLTIAFAAVYHASGNSLPPLTKERALELGKYYDHSPKMLVLTVNSYLKEIYIPWGEAFKRELRKKQLPIRAEYRVYFLVKTLLDEIIDEKKRLRQFTHKTNAFFEVTSISYYSYN